MSSATKTTFKYGVVASAVSSSIAVATSAGTTSYNVSEIDLLNETSPIFSNSTTEESRKITTKGEYYPEDHIEKWTTKHEKRFDRLLLLFHSHKATPEERAEFKRLRAARNNLKSPRSAEEVVAEIKRSELLDSALKSLEQYATLIEPNKKG